MNKPKISEFKNPRDYAAACEKYAQGLTQDPGARADEDEDEDEERADEDEPTDPTAPKLSSFADPRAYVAAVEAWRTGQRQDAKEAPASAYRTDDGGAIE